MRAQGSPERANVQAQAILRYHRFSGDEWWDEVGGNFIKSDGSDGILASFACVKVPRKGEGPSVGDPVLPSIFRCWAAGRGRWKLR
jgi:hypothetical protein